ncbi:MAG: hypothetical protein ACPG8W_03090 [Candidatus Promineifilaceae bacterium]
MSNQEQTINVNSVSQLVGAAPADVEAKINALIQHAELKGIDTTPSAPVVSEAFSAVDGCQTYSYDIWIIPGILWVEGHIDLCNIGQPDWCVKVYMEVHVPFFTLWKGNFSIGPCGSGTSNQEYKQCITVAVAGLSGTLCVGVDVGDPTCVFVSGNLCAGRHCTGEFKISLLCI